MREIATLFGRAREINFSPLSNNDRSITCWSPMRNIKTTCVARATHGNCLSPLLTAPTPLAQNMSVVYGLHFNTPSFDDIIDLLQQLYVNIAQSKYAMCT